MLNDGEPAVISVSWWIDEWNDYIFAVVDAFMGRYPNIMVDTLVFPYDDWRNITTLMIAAGDMPSILLLDYDKIRLIAYEWGAIDLLYDLHEFSSILDLSDYPQDWPDLMTVDGILAAVPGLRSTDVGDMIPQQGFAISGYTQNPELSAYFLNFLFNDFLILP
ncbi:MAG: hypothetical protein FWE92_06125 [Defluviitaleaceae bacterium]|nr:hypothetical protein [Defluviitaleaceae bacterium]